MSQQPPERTRVLVLTKGLGIGGAERLISEGARHWRRERFDYRVAYLLPWKDQLVPELARLEVTTECIGSGGHWDLRSLRRLRSLVKTWRPALIHAHLPTAGIAARVAGGTPVVYTEHNVPDSYRVPTRIANRLTYARNAAVIAVSDAVAQSLRGYPGPVPRVIPNGVSAQISPAEVAAARAEAQLSPDDRMVVHVGNIRPHKGHETLIAAAREVLEAESSIVFISIGGEKNAGDLARVRSLADSSGLGDRMRFLGRRDDARAFIAAADLVVNPSDFEGLPLAVLEALALARPVVATSVGGVPAVVIDGVTGRLVPPGESGELAAAIVETLGSPDARAWGEAGSKLVTADYGIDRMITEYELVYEEIANG